MDWLDLLTVQWTLKSLLQHHSSNESIFRHSAFLMVQLSYLYMTTGKPIASIVWTSVGKVMSLLFNMLSSLVITFFPRSKSCPALCDPVAVVHQAPLSMGFSRQDYWSGLPCPPPVHLPDAGIEPTSLYVSCIGRWVLYHEHHLGNPINSTVALRLF